MNVLIVEDEIMAQKSLARLLTRHFPDISITGCTDSGSPGKPCLNKIY